MRYFPLSLYPSSFFMFTAPYPKLKFPNFPPYKILPVDNSIGVQRWIGR